MIAIVVGAAGAVQHGMKHFIKRIGVHITVEDPQKTTLLGTAQLRRKMLEN